MTISLRERNDKLSPSENAVAVLMIHQLYSS